ncbi:MAG: penicillin-binding protein 2 [Thermoleophilia bacterium]|nr:penicillin-binding protein 2 [Thermoleophilia bacterium]
MAHANKRLALLMGLGVLFLLALLGRTFHVQVVAASELAAQADVQSLRTISVAAPRGVISDRDGDVLAVSEDMATIYANPRQVKDPQTAASMLAPVLGQPEETILAKLSCDAGFRYLARKVDPEIGDKVKALKLDGIGVCSEAKRVYPKGALAPQLLGFVGGDRDKGIAGLELEYDDVLSGRQGEIKVVTGREGRWLTTVATKDPVPGKSLVLNIDADIQFETERVLADTVEEFGAARACAVVLDPQTGEILAMANTPVFDANEFASSEVTDSDRRNMVVTDQYEPGSIFKVVTVAAALQAGLVQPDTVFRLERRIQVYDMPVPEAEEGNLPEIRELTVTQILARSSNVGTVKIALEVGKSKLIDMIGQFGFGEPLGVDFPGEIGGYVRPPEKWYGTTIARVPLGQGVAVTPLQMAAAYAALANSGVLVQPHLARDLVQPWRRQVVSPEVARQLREMLTVTVEDGTGRLAQVEGYTVAGKTGTAQKVRPEGGYYADRVVASFVGMIPAREPRVVILVTVDEPTKEHWGAHVAAPAFARIAKFAMQVLGVPPDATQ